MQELNLGEQLKRRRLSFPLLLVLLAPGCISTGWDVDMNPFYRSEPHREAGVTDTDALIPFLFAQESADIRTSGLRPLWVSERDESRSRSECDFIPPLGRYVSDEEGTRLRFWPLYWYEKTYHSGAGEDVDWILFPILFGGHSHDGENYFAVFPLGGHIRDFLGFEHFIFVLWPIYQQTTVAKSEGKESTSHMFLLLFGWTEGGNRDGSFQILPFYMRRVWEGKYRKYSVLWPFFHYQRNRLDTKHPSTLHSFWPLYSYESSGIHYQLGMIGPVLFLGPLIQMARETPEKWEGEPNEEGNSFYLYDLPWPLIRFEKKREFKRTRVIPFYASFNEPGFESSAYLIPFFWLRKEWNEAYEKRDFFFVPFYHQSRKVYKAGEGEDSYVHLWPLFHSTSNADGSRDFSTLSLLPLRVQKYVSALDKVLWPFWNLYRYRRDAAGASRHHALFSLFSVYHDPYETRVSIPLLYSGRFFHDEEWLHRFLWGVFSVGGDAQGLKRLRFLFIPFLDS